MLDVLVSQTVNGLVLGFLLVLVSIGLSLIFGLLGTVNVAHGANWSSLIHLLSAFLPATTLRTGSESLPPC